MSTVGEPDRSQSDAERAYRIKLEVLVEACLTRIRNYALPDDAEPANGSWERHD